MLFAREIAGVGDTGFGLLLAAGALGGVAGGLLADRVVRWIRAVGGLCGGVFITGAAQLALGLTTNLAVIVAALTASGFAFTLANVAVVTMRQRHTPTGLLGRVTATYRTVAMAASAAGAALGGVLAGQLGLRAALLAGAPALMLAAIVTAPLLHRYENAPAHTESA